MLRSSVRARQAAAGTAADARHQVSLDFGKVAWVNCFRIMLNAMGLDLNVDNDGPVKGAEVTWTGWAVSGDVGRGVRHRASRAVSSGDEAIASRAAGPPPLARTHEQVTNEHGEARVTSPASARTNPRSQPREVMRRHRLRDGGAEAGEPRTGPEGCQPDGGGGLPGALAIPAELLLRTRWTFGGNYTFPVKDWRAGNGWTGTVSYRLIKRTLTQSSRQSVCCGGQTTTHENREQREEIRRGAGSCQHSVPIR